MRYDRLREYLEARREGGFGWIPRYDEKVANGNMALLAGHYSALLADVLDLTSSSPASISAAIEVAREIEELRRERERSTSLGPVRIFEELP